MTPEDINNDKENERKYIINKLYFKEERKKIKDFKLEDGEFVRYLNIKDKRHRYKISPEAYQVSFKDGNSYVTHTEDGTAKTIQRWRLFPLGIRNKNDLKKTKFGKTLGGNKGVVDKISKKIGPNTFGVDYIYPDGHTETFNTTKIGLRGNTPHLMSKAEKDFLQMCAMKNSPF